MLFLPILQENRYWNNNFILTFVYAAHRPKTIFIPSRARVQGVNSWLAASQRDCSSSYRAEKWPSTNCLTDAARAIRAA